MRKINAFKPADNRKLLRLSRAALIIALLLVDSVAYARDINPSQPNVRPVQLPRTDIPQPRLAKPTLAADMLPKRPLSMNSASRQAPPSFGLSERFPPAMANSECQLKLEAKLPMTERFGQYSVLVEIGGKKQPMVVNTGANRTSITPEIADVWHLEEDTSRASQLQLVGGSSASQYPRILPSLKLGSAEWINQRVVVLPVVSSSEPTQGTPPIGVLGADVMSRYDVEFDFPARTMTLYSASGCLGRFAPWTGDFQAHSTDVKGGRSFVLRVSLNGQPLRAELVTGAQVSLLSRAGAAAAGVDSAMLERDPQSSGSSAAGPRITTYLHNFDMTIGTATFEHAPLSVADVTFADSDMLLGMDFMRYRRVWVSYSTGWVFMQLATGKS